MQATKKPRVKICCISSTLEAQLAIQYGASALGLVSAMPSGPGVIAEDLIAQIAATIPPTVSSFLLTSKQDAASIIVQQRRCGVNTIQICDRFLKDGYKKLRDALLGIALVQVIHVTGEASIEEAVAVAPYVNGILLEGKLTDSLCFTEPTRGQEMLRSFYSLLAVKRGKRAGDEQDMLQKCSRELGEVTHLVLIRPDGYISFCSQPIAGEPLLSTMGLHPSEGNVRVNQP